MSKREEARRLIEPHWKGTRTGLIQVLDALAPLLNPPTRTEPVMPSQDSTTDQMKRVLTMAERAGEYDAGDAIRRWLESGPIAPLVAGSASNGDHGTRHLCGPDCQVCK